MERLGDLPPSSLLSTELFKFPSSSHLIHKTSTRFSFTTTWFGVLYLYDRIMIVLLPIVTLLFHKNVFYILRVSHTKTRQARPKTDFIPIFFTFSPLFLFRRRRRRDNFSSTVHCVLTQNKKKTISLYGYLHSDELKEGET